MDYIEVNKSKIVIDESINQEKDVISIKVYDYEINTSIDLYLDKKTAIRFAKSVRTEINKIP